MDFVQFPEILPFGNFLPGKGKFFWELGISSPANIPSTDTVSNTTKDNSGFSINSNVLAIVSKGKRVVILSNKMEMLANTGLPVKRP